MFQNKSLIDVKIMMPKNNKKRGKKRKYYKSCYLIRNVQS